MDIKDIIKETEEYIKKYVEQSGAKGVVLGISGGIDSAVVAHLAIRALGKDNVVLLHLPDKNILDDEAMKLCGDLGVDLCIIKIDRITGEFLISTAGLPKNKLTKGNLMSRIRMCVLYMYANEKNYLVIGTTNLSEMVIGYYTKYGDGGVDFEPIGHIMKTTIIKMAEELGVPQKIIDKAPSAGLWEGQTDEKEMGFTYEQLDEYIKHGHDPDEPSHVLIEKMIDNSEHKKHMPPSLDVIR